MGVPEPHQLCYLAEWYGPEVASEALDRTIGTLDESAAAMSIDGVLVRLLTVVSVPTDDVVFGVFAASSEELVTQTCQRAGLPAQRLTAAVTTLPPQPLAQPGATRCAASPRI